jgi:hypothetical protein
VSGIPSKQKPTIKLYPNPVSADQSLHIQLPETSTGSGTLQIYDKLGQVVLEKELQTGTADRTKSVSLNSLAGGIYTVKLTLNDRYITRKIQLMPH